VVIPAVFGLVKGASVREARSPEHDPEKWKPVFGKDHAKN
jgi:hypothetical protein